MDLKGSLVDTNVRVYPSIKLIDFLKSLPFDEIVPKNVLKFTKSCKEDKSDKKLAGIYLTSDDIKNIEKYTQVLEKNNTDKNIDTSTTKENSKKKNNKNKGKSTTKDTSKKTDDTYKTATAESKKDNADTETKKDSNEETPEEYLTTPDIDWLYDYLKKKRNEGEKNIPYLHALLEGSNVEVPENETLKRNPVLEARCVKLRAQQEARDYRKMTKSVDNVRLRFPEDSISYQLKSINRQLIAIGQFIISIFAGFLFGFKGIEWMYGTLDFGFRLLLGVMCALVIALAEIYFLAKKLNEELNVQEPVQLGGPNKFANEPKTYSSTIVNKEHQD